MKVCKSKSYLPTIAHEFTAHNEIAACILDHKGDNNYLLTIRRLLFGIRRMYMTNEKEDGVIPVPMAMVERERQYRLSW